jgi:uncharacterized protein YjbI with pentapeptide repeats
MSAHRWAIAPLIVAMIGLGCSQRDQDLYAIEVDRACLNCDLRGVNLPGENLSSRYRISITSSPLATGPDGLSEVAPVDLSGSNLQEANLRRANLFQVMLTETNLAYADLSETDLKEAQLDHANLSHANLRDANLQGANLRNANLTHADLRGTNLQEANLTGADLTEILVDEETLIDITLN